MNLGNKILLGGMLTSLSLFTACSQSGTTESGRAYEKFSDSSSSALTPDSTSFVAFRAEVFKDSLIASVGYTDGMPVIMPMQNLLAAQGDPTAELLMLIAAGDSIVTTVKAEELMIPSENPTDELELRLKLLEVFTDEAAVRTFADSLSKIAMQNYEVRMKKMQAEEEGVLEEYIEENKLSPEKTASGLQYIISEEGIGLMPKAGDTVSVHYTGTLLNGEKFDSSLDRNEPIEFVLGTGQVIKGWDEGIALLKKGGKATFLIPSNLAYGERGAGGVIQPYSPLKFEVELVDVKKPAQDK